MSDCYTDQVKQTVVALVDSTSVRVTVVLLQMCREGLGGFMMVSSLTT